MDVWVVHWTTELGFLGYRLKLWAPKSALRAISVVAELVQILSQSLLGIPPLAKQPLRCLLICLHIRYDMTGYDVKNKPCTASVTIDRKKPYMYRCTDSQCIRHASVLTDRSTLFRRYWRCRVSVVLWFYTMQNSKLKFGQKVVFVMSRWYV